MTCSRSGTPCGYRAAFARRVCRFRPTLRVRSAGTHVRLLEVAVQPETATELEFLAWVDQVRVEASQALDEAQQAGLSQYFTPSTVASLMATMISPRSGECRVLDPGAGCGTLAAHAAVRLVAGGGVSPNRIHIVAYELDPALRPIAERVFDQLARWTASRDVGCSWEVRSTDFLAAAAGALDADRCEGDFDISILNPPYGKVGKDSTERAHASALGAHVPNVYAAFMAAAVACTRTGGDVVSITPRSFCNGSYFKRFRSWMLDRSSVERIHVYDSRGDAFRDDLVLQETIITHLVAGGEQSPSVSVTAQATPAAPLRERRVPFSRVVQPADREKFIHIVPDEASDHVALRMQSFSHHLDDLGLTVSTGRVVDFRCRDLLLEDYENGSIPLLYPMNLTRGLVRWPRRHRGKPQAIHAEGVARGLTVPDGDYVLVKRFTSKEERRRVSASWLGGGVLDTRHWGFENHLNYVHSEGHGMDREMALGLTIFLNSTLVDDYVRQFSGHTQVNAGDLRSLRYPSAQQLKSAGAQATREVLGDQEQTDFLCHTIFECEESA